MRRFLVSRWQGFRSNLDRTDLDHRWLSTTRLGGPSQWNARIRVALVSKLITAIGVWDG
jgi:hypothetical protein